MRGRPTRHSRTQPSQHSPLPSSSCPTSRSSSRQRSGRRSAALLRSRPSLPSPSPALTAPLPCPQPLSSSSPLPHPLPQPSFHLQLQPTRFLPLPLSRYPVLSLSERPTLLPFHLHPRLPRPWLLPPPCPLFPPSPLSFHQVSPALPQPLPVAVTCEREVLFLLLRRRLLSRLLNRLLGLRRRPTGEPSHPAPPRLCLLRPLPHHHHRFQSSHHLCALYLPHSLRRRHRSLPPQLLPLILSPRHPFLRPRYRHPSCRPRHHPPPLLLT